MNKKVFIFLLTLCLTIGFTSCRKVVTSEASYKGENNMAWAIAHYVEYPVEEMQFNRKGIVKITFEVNEEGKVDGVKAILDGNLKEAEIAIARKKLANKEILPINLPVIQSLIKSVEKLNFLPAEKNGKAMKSTITTSVEFMLI